MLYDNESISNYRPSNVIIWMLMAFQGGFLNMGGFMACHRFVSHLTGYGTLFPYELGQKHWREALSMTVVPIAFFLGAMLSGFLVDVRLKLHKKPKYYLAFGLIFIIIAAVIILGNLKVFGVFGEPLMFKKDYALLIMLAFVCGVQNGTITSVSKAVIRTTHLSGIITDLGIGFSRLIFSGKLPDLVQDEKRATLMRLGIIFFFMLGSLNGFTIFSLYEYNGFFIPLLTSGLLFFVMIFFALKKRV